MKEIKIKTTIPRLITNKKGKERKQNPVQFYEDCIIAYKLIIIQPLIICKEHMAGK